MKGPVRIWISSGHRKGGQAAARFFSRIRLAAAWTLGEICRRQESLWLPDNALDGLRQHLADNEPRIRLTAAETLESADVRKR